MASDTGDTASAISSYAENTTLSEFGSDVGAALSKVETYENIAGSVIAAGAISKVSKLGSINKTPKASPNVQKALNTLDEIKADGGQVNMNKLQSATSQELNMTVTKGTGKVDVRVETHVVPKKYGGNGTTPQKHLNVDLYPKKTNPLPNKGHKILEE